MLQLSLPLDIPSSKINEKTWFQTILQSLNVEYNAGWSDRFGIAIRRWLALQGHVPIKTLSLFSGGGGLDIAFHELGFEILQMVELEAKYVQTLKQNSKPGKLLENSQPVCIDIREYFPSQELKVDFIIGGPPCQTFSAAGRRAAGATGTSDIRGTLFQEYVRILKILQPKGFLFENVYGITGTKKGEDWEEIQKAFKEAGYKIYYRLLDAADYGVAQHRERLFIVGLKEGCYLFPYPTHGSDSPGQEALYPSSLAIAGLDILEAEKGIGGRYGHLLEGIPPGLNYSFYTAKMGYPNPVFSWRSKFSDFLYKADPHKPVRTIKAQGGQYTGPFSWENRKFTIAELKRLQTIPDNYELVGNRQACIEQIGNSVPPQLGRILALSILNQVMGVSLPFMMHYLPTTKQLGFRQRKRQLTEIYAQKAKEAIAILNANQNAQLSSDICFTGELVRFLSHNFGWLEKEISSCQKIYLKYQLHQSSWIITARKDDVWTEENPFVIEISPVIGCKNWVLSTKKVQLCANQLDEHIFTSLWKGFEEKLKEITGMADLVQLSGYYQYSPKINGAMHFHPQLSINNFWNIVQFVVSGIGVAQQISESKLAALWGIDVKDLLINLKSLRLIGYEIRNHKTNSQIPKGEYLIPYIFPTFTPRSIQLKKSLGNEHE
jgi:DNA (cytosine-5)-methyltransferase 1